MALDKGVLNKHQGFRRAAFNRTIFCPLRNQVDLALPSARDEAHWQVKRLLRKTYPLVHNHPNGDRHVTCLQV